LLGLRELRGEVVSTLSAVALEVLGLDTALQSQFRDGTLDKSQHPDFIELLDQNKFLGIGDNYLRSDQIVRVRFYEPLFLS
jgi:hypothetical protein